MKPATQLLLASLLVSSPGIARAELPAAKQDELVEAGRVPWTGPQRPGGVAAVEPLPGESLGPTGTMRYDDGNLSALPTGFGIIYGNRFLLGMNGSPLSTITLNTFSFYFLEDDLADTDLFFQPADPLNTASILARASVNVTGLVNSGPSFSNPVLNVVPQSALGTPGTFFNTFLLGAWSLNSATALPVDNEAVGLATNTTGLFGGGIDGFRGYTAESGTGTQPFARGPFQVILRATVTTPNFPLVPVELMAFQIEE